jgi:hypothetical protein
VGKATGANIGVVAQAVSSAFWAKSSMRLKHVAGKVATAKMRQDIPFVSLHSACLDPACFLLFVRTTLMEIWLLSSV